MTSSETITVKRFLKLKFGKGGSEEILLLTIK